MKQSAIHETFSRGEKIAPGSERSFGTVMAAACAAVATINWWHDGKAWPWTALVSVALLLTSLLCPIALKPLNRLWFKFGLLLHDVINPIVMGFVFYLAVVPTGLIMRAMHRDILRLRRNPEAATYWIKRENATAETMKDQF